MSRIRPPAAAAVRLIAPLALLAAGSLSPLAALAQSNPGYFIPPSARPASPPQQQQLQRPPAARRPTREPMVQTMPPPEQGPAQAGEEPQGPQMQMQLPPMPTLPTMARGAPPPAAVIGVLGIPEIMRASTAAQQVEKTVGERREKLSQDAQKEQLVWREMQQGLATDRGKLSADQIRAREKELQDRITTAQKTFRDRNRVIQEAGQYGLAQIERILVSVIRQVSESRGMNLVLHRSQVALNVNEFDITDQVVEQLNKVLPTVALPADGVEPPMIQAAQNGAPGGGAPNGGATPAATPPTPAGAPTQGTSAPPKK